MAPQAIAGGAILTIRSGLFTACSGQSFSWNQAETQAAPVGATGCENCSSPSLES